MSTEKRKTNRKSRANGGASRTPLALVGAGLARIGAGVKDVGGDFATAWRLFREDLARRSRVAGRLKKSTKKASAKSSRRKNRKKTHKRRRTTSQRRFQGPIEAFFKGRPMRLAALGASLGSLALGAGLAAAFLYFAPRDQIGADLWAVNRLPSVIVLDRYGDEVAARGARYGEAVRIEDLPDHLVNAFLATEDRRFYNHMGVDIRGTMRAAFSNIKSGGVVEGGSTITQQLAKVLFLSPEQTYERKIREALLALWLEGHYEKNEILSLYLNRIYLGAGAYGIESASKTYFNKSASDVTLAEAVLLAGLPKAPSSLAPTQNPFGAESRAREVLDNLLETGAVTPFEARTARENPPVITSSNVDAGLGYFFDYVAAKAQEYAIARANDASNNSASNNSASDNSAGDGSAGEKNSGAARAQATIRNDLIVSTTLDLRMQKAAEAAIAKAITTEAKLAGAEQAALVAYDADGALRALVGGVSYVESQFNRATQAKRQPGSAFKPFVYVAALENGVTTQTKFIDQPVDIDGWRPENYSGRFDGPMRLTEALAKSVNTIAVQITEQVGRKKVAEAAKRLGVKADVPAHPSIALGASNMTLEDLTAAYLPLARGGLSADPYAITKIVDQSGNIVFERDAAPAKRVLSAKVSRDMNHLLYQVMHNGTGGRAQLGRRAAVGKTGTTNDWRDAWFMGYTAQMTTGVWVGNDNFRGMEKITGGKIPAEIWRDFMLAAHQDLPRRPINGATPAVIHADEDALLSFYDDVARGLRTVRRDGGDGGGRRVFRRR